MHTSYFLWPSFPSFYQYPRSGPRLSRVANIAAYRCYRANSLSLLLTLSHYRNATDRLMPTFIGRREELLVLPRYAAALLFIIRNKLHETNLSCFSWPCMEWPSRLCVECDSILKATLIGSSDGLSQAFQVASNI